MGSENIKLRKRNFAVHDGYFYNIDEDQDNFLQKTDDGNTAFSYPFDTLITTQCLSLEFDGVYFWALHDTGGNDMVLYRWKIDNYVCKLQETINFTETGSHSYDSEAFSIEHYHDTFASSTSSGSKTINMTTYSGSVESGYVLHLGPNSDGNEEDVVIDTAVAGVVTTVSGVNYDFDTADPINYYTNIWMFNNFNGTSSTVGALYKFDRNGNYITKYPGGAYTNIKAATFYTVDAFPAFGDVDTLVYVKNSNMLFIDISGVGSTLSFYGSMIMENIQSNLATVLPIYDLSMYGQNIYRLQKGPDAGGGESWTYYSYELSSFDSFVSSISLAADPAVIAANEVSTSNITAYVKDQFWNPVVGRAVTYSVDGSDGAVIVGSNPVNTNADGRSTTVLKSGDEAREVKITAVVEQV